MLRSAGKKDQIAEEDQGLPDRPGVDLLSFIIPLFQLLVQ